MGAALDGWQRVRGGCEISRERRAVTDTCEHRSQSNRCGYWSLYCSGVGCCLPLFRVSCWSASRGGSRMSLIVRGQTEPRAFCDVCRGRRAGSGASGRVKIILFGARGRPSSPLWPRWLRRRPSSPSHPSWLRRRPSSPPRPRWLRRRPSFPSRPRWLSRRLLSPSRPRPSRSSSLRCSSASRRLAEPWPSRRHRRRRIRSARAAGCRRVASL